MNAGDKVELLVDDIIGRYSSGEHGVILERCEPGSKYHYFVELPGLVPVTVLGKKTNAVRMFYFHDEELKRCDPSPNAGAVARKVPGCASGMRM
jgi:hypothetical protein